MDWSAIPKQKHLVENGEIGDCWRCCIAAVLGLPAENVPHFLLGEDGKHNNNCDADTQKWLNERGLLMFYASAVGGRTAIWFPRWSESKFPLPPIISCGPTDRSQGMGKHHAVVMVGNEVVYDPHPSEAGLTAITEQYLILRPVTPEQCSA